MPDKNLFQFEDILREILLAREIQGQSQEEETDTISDVQDELCKLHMMLKDAGIPHKYLGNQIVYYGLEDAPKPVPGMIYGAGIGSVCSVIDYGYGSDEGLLEIYGLLTEEEYDETGDFVLGSLTAENVFERINKHLESSMEGD